MAPLGPFGARREVVAAVSGGADSMALALLLRGWGAPLAVVVDHGLRPGSADEAAVTAARLAALGVPCRVERLMGLGPGPNLGARARAARYACLLEVCRRTGRPDLVLGHHARDQAETVALRRARGSGAAGLAGMAAVAWHDAARLLRPLLAVAPERLRATLRAAGVGWVEDPGNADPSTARGRLRQGPWAAVPPEPGVLRAGAEAALAAELARSVTLYPGGYAEVAGALSPAAWSALVWTLSGRAYPPGTGAVARLARTRLGTLHGVAVRGGVAAREGAALGAAVPAVAGARWDGRFVLREAVAGAAVGAVGAAAARLRRRPGLPARVLAGLPAVWRGTDLLAIPHLDYADAQTCFSVGLDFCPTRPLAGMDFTPTRSA